jgi:heat shock protein HslJ
VAEEGEGKGSLSIAGFKTTMEAGPKLLRALETRYLEFLHAARSWSVQDGHLLLEDDADIITLLFERDPYR